MLSATTATCHGTGRACSWRLARERMLPSLVHQASRAGCRESPGTGTGKGQAGLGGLQGRRLEPRDATPSLCDWSKARQQASPRRSTHVQLGKENMASTEQSPLCQLSCFPADLLLFLHSITAEQRHNKET